MNVFDYIQNNGEKVVPNPKYNPRSKKNKEPKYISIADIGGEEEDNIVKGLRNKIDEDYVLPTNVAKTYEKFGINPSKRFHQNLDYEISEAQSNWTKLGNAILQTISEVGLGTVQAFTDIPGMVRGGFGQLADGILNDVFDVKGEPVQQALGVNEDDPYGNAISNTIEDWRNKIKEDIAPIHTTPGVDIDTGGLSNIGWYLSGLPNVATSLTLLLPTKFISGAIGGVSKMVKAANVNRKTEKLIQEANKVKELSALAKSEQAEKVAAELTNRQKWLNNPITQARFERALKDSGEGLIMRSIENYQEAHQTYNDVYATASSRLAEMSPNEYAEFIQDNQEELEAVNIDVRDRNAVAKWVAKQAADRTFLLDYSNLLFDIIQLHQVRDIGRVAKNVTSGSIKRTERKALEAFTNTSEELSKKVGKGKLKELGLTVRDYVTGSAKKVLKESTEGIEEAINYIAQQEGITYGNSLLDGETDATLNGFWNNRLKSYLNNSELHESAFWGVGGGLVFGKFAGAYNRYKAYQANKAREDLRKLNPQTGEEIKTTDSNNPLNDFIRLSEMPEIQAAKEAIMRRGSRAEQFFIDMNNIENDKDPYNELKPFDGDKAIGKAIAKINKITEFRQAIAFDALNSGTYDSLIDWLKNEKVKQVFNAKTNEGEAFIEETIRDLEKTKEIYYNELSHVNYQVGILNGRRKDKIPLEYVQQIARDNADKRLMLDAIDKEIAALELQEGSELGKTNLQVNESMDTKQLVRLNMLADRYSRLEADKRAIKENNEINAWTKAQSLDAIDTQQQTIIRLITKDALLASGETELTNTARERGLGVALFAFRMAKTYRRLGKNDYAVDEHDPNFAKSDEELIKEYENVFKGSTSSNTTIGELAKQFQKELFELTGEQGLFNQNRRLYDLYSNLAVLSNERAIIASEINSTQNQIANQVDVIHNQNNEVRKRMQLKANKVILELHDKYYDTKSRELEQVIISAYLNDPEKATQLARQHFTGTDENGHRDSEKLISALAIINFSNASNKSTLQFIANMLRLNDEKHRKQSKNNPVSQNPISEPQSNEVNNLSQTQINEDTSGVSNEISVSQDQNPVQPTNPLSNDVSLAPIDTTPIPSASIPQAEVNGDDNQPYLPAGFDGPTLVVEFDNNGEPIISNGYRKPNQLPARVNSNANRLIQYELLISDIPDNKQTQFILSNLFNGVEGDVLQEGKHLVIRKNPVVEFRVDDKTYTLSDKGEAELIDDTEVISTSPIPLTGGQFEANDTNTSNNVEDNKGATLMSQSQKDLIVDNAVRQFLDFTSDTPNFESSAKSAKEFILGKYPNMFANDELDKLISDNIQEYRDALEEIANIEGSDLEKSADKFGLAARYEEGHSDNFSDLFRRTAETFIKEYASIYKLPIIDGKQVIRLKDLLNICNRGNTSGNSLAKSIYDVACAYLLSPEGKTKYIVADEEDIRQNKVLEDVGKSSEQLIREKAKHYEQRVDLDVYRSDAESTQNTAYFAAMNALKVGDTLKVLNVKIQQRHGKRGTWGLEFSKDNVVLGSMPAPYKSQDGGYYYFNEGWKTDVRLLGNGDIQSDFLDVVRNIFTATDINSPAYEILALLNNPELKRNKKGVIEVPDNIIETFKTNDIIKQLVKDSTGKESYAEQKVYIDRNTGEADYANMIRHLKKLYDYTASCIGNDINDGKDDTIDKLNRIIVLSLNMWGDMLYKTYDNIHNTIQYMRDAPEVPMNVTVSEITDGGVNFIVTESSEGEDKYDSLLPVASALAPKTKARVSMVKQKQNDVIMTSPEDGSSVNTYDSRSGFKAGTTLLTLFDRNNVPTYITALGARLTDSKMKDNEVLGHIFGAVNNIIADIAKEIVDNKNLDSIKKLEEILTNILATPDTPDNVIPIFRAVRGMFHISPVSTDKFEGVNISFTDSTDDSKFGAIAIYNRTKWGGLGYKCETGNPVTLNLNTGSSRGNAEEIIRKTIMNFIQSHCCINIDANGIKSDAGSVVSGGWLKTKIDSDKNKFVIDIPGPKPYHAEFDSYNDYLIKGNLLRVNTYPEGDSNFSAMNELQQASQILRVDMVDFRQNSSPVEEIDTNEPSVEVSDSTNVDDSVVNLDSSLKDFKAIHSIIASNNDNKGLEIFKYLKGENNVEEINKILQELGIGEFNIFPKDLIYDQYYNYKDENGIDGGFIATTNPYDEVVEYRNYPHGKIPGVESRRTQKLAPNKVVLGFRLLNMLSSDNESVRNEGIRKLIHERIHQIIHDPFITPDTTKVLGAIEKVYNLYKAAIDSRIKNTKESINKLSEVDINRLTKNDATAHNDKLAKLNQQLEDYYKVDSFFNSLSGDELLEEFITEGMTNEILYNFLNSVDYIKGTDEYLDNIPENGNKSIFAKLMDLIAKFFGWETRLDPRHENSLYEKFYETLRNVFNEPEDKGGTKPPSPTPPATSNSSDPFAALAGVNIRNLRGLNAAVSETTQNPTTNYGYKRIPSVDIVRRNLSIEQRNSFNNLIKSGIVTYKCS